MEWKTLEDAVRLTASYIWSREAGTGEINGVQIDCIVKLREDYWVLAEVTRNEALYKLREDLAKFASVRPYLHSQDIYAECYFVCEDEPTASLIETGRGQHVTVLSLRSFNKKFWDYDCYHHVRSQKRFGSAVDPYSLQKDENTYVPVQYIDPVTRKSYGIDDLAKMLLNHKNLVLIGNYGTGKSRCVQELFHYLNQPTPGQKVFPISIDLRDNWGVKRGHEIVRRHFDDLGLSDNADKLIKVMDKGSICLLLDGFDEIGSQAWSEDSTRLRSIRKESLSGVKDLIQISRGGLVITGRAHYFNSDQEMYECLGLNPKTVLILECPDEFSDQEMAIYLRTISNELTLPHWLPRRPLICQIFGSLDADLLTRVLNSNGAEVEFWETLISSICEREARIKAVLDPHVVRRVLTRIARLTRLMPGDVGPISPAQMNRAFEDVVGSPAVDESGTMLLRLATLGRVKAETGDRQFLDTYILDGLRAEDLLEIVNSKNEPIRFERWVNPLQGFGLSLLSSKIAATNLQAFVSAMHQVAKYLNHIFVSDILAAILLTKQQSLDLKGLEIADSHISFLDLSQVQLSNLSIRDSFIDEIDITESRVMGVNIHNCVIRKIYGVSAEKGLPEWLRGNTIEKYEAVDTVSRIREADLNPSQRIFLTIVKKTFFQPGSGRKEVALLRGLGATSDKKTATRILNLLLKEGVLSRLKGAEGWVYHPNRALTERMKRILSELSICQDPLWVKIDES